MRKLLFVDDEPRILQGMQRQLRAMRHEWEMDFVESGAKALELMAATPVDVLVTDMMMPGMDGAQLLTEVRQRHPNIVRIVLSGQSDRESVLKLVGPAHQYLSKPCNATELRDAIGRSFALRELLVNQHLKRLTTQVCTLPTLPALHVQLTEELRKENPAIERVCEIISQDLGMSSKIVQLVNSAFFGLPQTVARMSDAIIYLGLTTVRDLVLTLQVFKQFDQAAIKDFSIEELFRHCCQTATLARKIAALEHCSPKFLDQCFLAGLLHDVGELILVSSLPGQHASVVENARKNNLANWQAEYAEYGTTHAEVGGYLLAIWGLPMPVVEAVIYHHQPPTDCQHTGFTPAVAVHVADALSDKIAGSHPDLPANQIDTTWPEKLGLKERLTVWKTECFAA